MPPDTLPVDAFVEPEWVNLEPPVLPDPPRTPVFGTAKYGHDWTGLRPFLKDLPAFVQPAMLDEKLIWQHPPNNMPRLGLEELSLDTATLDLDPIPKLELAWESGPEPEPSYASIQTSPRMSRTPSRAPSPPRSPPKSPSLRPSYAGQAAVPQGPSRPSSAGPGGPAGLGMGPSLGPSPGPSTARTTPTPSAYPTRPSSAVPAAAPAPFKGEDLPAAVVDGVMYVPLPPPALLLPAPPPPVGVPPPDADPRPPSAPASRPRSGTRSGTRTPTSKQGEPGRPAFLTAPPRHDTAHDTSWL